MEAAVARVAPHAHHSDPSCRSPFGNAIDPLHMVWTAAVRKTSSGAVLGADECIPVGDALRAVTIDALPTCCATKRTGAASRPASLPISSC